MNIKEWIIKKLEKDVEFTAGHINLEQLNEEERNACFNEFGEGDDNLTLFLKSAYKNGAPSLFCCSGHGVRSPYVVLKVTDNNIELLRKIGKILSKQEITTNFTNDYIRGVYVTYKNMRDSASTDWLRTAAEIIENPELFKDITPEIYYHEEIHSSYKPFGFDFKKKLLAYLRGTKMELPDGNQEEQKKKWWELSDEERKRANGLDREIIGTPELKRKVVEDKSK